MCRFHLLVATFLILLANTTATAQESTLLDVNSSIERTLNEGQVHTYTINLKAGDFVELVVEQHGIDVVVKVANPARVDVGTFDTPNGDDGPEDVPFVAPSEGAYTIMIMPLNRGAQVKPGRYEIKVLDLRKATEQELNSVLNRETLTRKAVAMVQEAVLLIPQLRQPTARIHAQIQAAGLLWTSDEKAARKLLYDAVAGLKEIMANPDPGDPDHAMEEQQAVLALRFELVHAVAAYDPELALKVLHATRPAESEAKDGGRTSQEHQLELTLANQIANKDPKRALQIAEEKLKQRLSASLAFTIDTLQRNDPELARQLAKDVATKLQDQRVLGSQELLELTLSLLRENRVYVRRRADAGAGSPNRLLDDEDLRALLQKTLSEALNTTSSNSPARWDERDRALMALRTLKEQTPSLERLLPGSADTVNKKIAELEPRTNARAEEWQKLEKLNADSPDMTAALNDAPKELREQMYAKLAERAAAGGDFGRARQIIDEQFNDSIRHRQAMNNLEQQIIYQQIAKGKIEEALRHVAAITSNRERSRMIAQIAHQIGPGRKRAAALVLLEQTRSLLNTSPRADDEDEMQALFELAAAFNRYDSKRSFQIMDPLVDQFNEITDAARKLSGFGQDSFRDGELLINNGNTVMTLGTRLSGTLANLALSNFEQAKAAIERIDTPEIRLLAYLVVGQRIIDPSKQSTY